MEPPCGVCQPPRDHTLERNGLSVSLCGKPKDSCGAMPKTLCKLNPGVVGEVGMDVLFLPLLYRVLQRSPVELQICDLHASAV